MTKKLLSFLLITVLISGCNITSPKNDQTNNTTTNKKVVKTESNENNAKEDDKADKNDYGKMEYDEINTLMISFSENLENWQEIDERLITAAANEDPDAMFLEYKNFQNLGEEILNQIETIYFELDAKRNEKAVSYLFIPIANAKERWSMWYYVPVVGSLIKAKHQSIETARAGVYQYLKDLPEMDRKDLLDQYGVNDIEDIRKANDTTVEKLARDPEIRSGIDWTKVTTDLGETAVKTVVDAGKSVLSGGISPIKDTATNFVDDIKDDGKLDKIEDETGKIKIKQEKKNDNSIQVDMGIKKDIETKIANINTENEGKKWWEISEEDKKDISDAVIEEAKKGPIAVVIKQDASDGGEKDVPVGDWDFISTNSNSAPIEIPNITIEKNKTVEIIKPEIDLSKHFNLDFINKAVVKNVTENVKIEEEINDEPKVTQKEITELSVFKNLQSNFSSLDTDGNKVLTNSEIATIKNDANGKIVDLITKHSHELMFANIDSNSSAWYGMTAEDVSGIVSRLANGNTIVGSANSLRSKYAGEREINNDYWAFKNYVDSNR